MDENEQNQAGSASLGSGIPGNLADAPQQQADADARIAATETAQRDAFGLAPVVKVDDAEAKQADAADDLAAQQDAAAKAGTTAHPSGLPAAAAFGQRMQDAMFRLRNHGYDEVTSLLDDLYTGVQRVEATARGEKPVVAVGAPQQPGESDADYAARTSA